MIKKTDGGISHTISEVGTFEESEYPQKNGKYRYLPYRGFGHLEIQNEIDNGSFSQCYYNTNTERVTFSVIDCLDYGILELANFERTELNK